MSTTTENLRGLDSVFNVFQENIMNYLGQTKLPFTITTEEINAGKALQTKWTTALAKVNNLATKTPVATQEKNDARKAYYTACWVNSRGDMGDWCKFIEAIIN